MKTKLTEQNKNDIRAAVLHTGEALYLTGGQIVVGKDGCQPSNSSCIATGPWVYDDSDTTIDDIEAAL